MAPADTHAYLASDRGRSHSARVTREIGLAIVAGDYPQNAILPTAAELMQQFGVSRTVLREAMKTLAAKGLIQAKARIGTRVRERSGWNLFDPDVLIWLATSGFEPAFLVHLSEMRLALEPEAAALAAERHTSEQLAEICHCAAAMGAQGVSPDAFVDADLHFHLAVAAAASNPFMLSVSTLIEVALVALLRISSPARDPVRLSTSVAAHRAVAEAIGRRDAAAARSAMRAVVQQGLDITRANELQRG